ncbi:ribonuclease III [Rothia aerolata]|uniref:Ribonuclease 3 n=1 Tax=Rothia aerolata TaxID=1812262 RepID=A0A917MQT1_9MICC|nr:ribonuclease III [Rothia aerolata]GGH58797.1 ribonuclease 3 [Rothia aerolata]
MKNSDSSDLLKRLGVNIDAETFQHALTHSSYSFENPGVPNNERLEFLGDSVLSLAIAEETYVRFPDLDEGELVKRHHVVVSAWALAKVARSLELGPHIRMGKGEARSGGADKDNILADTMEAIFGACYLSNGREAARELVLRLIGPMLFDEEILEGGRDWKTDLQVLVQGQKLGEIRYRVTGEGPDHARTYSAVTVVGEREFEAAVASAKKEAERLSARLAFKALGGV